VRFLADESCDFSVVRALRKAGHEVTAIAELSPAAQDDAVLHVARSEGRILLTEDIVLDLLEGITILWLYAAIRPRYGPGARTAIIAAFAWWFIVSLGDATWCSFGFFPASTAIPLMIGTIPAIILATLTGAKFYKE